MTFGQLRDWLAERGIDNRDVLADGVTLHAHGFVADSPVILRVKVLRKTLDGEPIVVDGELITEPHDFLLEELLPGA